MQRYIKVFAAQVAESLTGESSGKPIYELLDFKLHARWIRELGALMTASSSSSSSDPTLLRDVVAPPGSSEEVVFATQFATHFVHTLACLHRPQDWSRAYESCTRATLLFCEAYLKAFERDRTMDTARAAHVLLQKSLSLAKGVRRAADDLDERLQKTMSMLLRMHRGKSEFDRQVGLMLMQVCTVRLACQCRSKRYTSALTCLRSVGRRLDEFVPTEEEAAAGRADHGPRAWLPGSVWVTFCYYYGRVALLAEDLQKAHTLLTLALKRTLLGGHKDGGAHHASSTSTSTSTSSSAIVNNNARRIAVLLIPLNLRRLKYPSLDLLRRTNLLELFGPLMLHVVEGNLRGLRDYLDSNRLRMLRQVVVVAFCR